jgi:transposase
VVGRFTAHHAFLLAEQLSHLDSLEEAIDRMSAEIAQRLREEQTALELLDTVPGLARRARATAGSARC